MANQQTVYIITIRLEEGRLQAEDALGELAAIVYTVTNRAERVRAYSLIGDLAGRAFNATWATAAKAAWVLLDLVWYVDGLLELHDLILAMGRGSRNIWLMPFVHSQLSHEQPLIVEAAIQAAGGLCFSQLEETIAGNFLVGDIPRHLQVAAIYSLGRMGAVSVEARLCPFIGENSELTRAALTALTEMYSPVGISKAIELSRVTEDEEVLLAILRYLAELGSGNVVPMMRRCARGESNELRLAAGYSSLVYAQECSQAVSERILVALAEKDIAVRTTLARRLRTKPSEQVVHEAMMLFDDDPEGIIHLLGEVRGELSSRLLLEIATNRGEPVAVRVYAIAALVASDGWIRDGLAALINCDELEDEVRVAAVHAIGGFAPIEETFAEIGRLSQREETAVKGAMLWALQLTASLSGLSAEDRAFCEQELRYGLNDRVDWIRRRSAYVAGHLRIRALASDLVALAVRESDAPQLRTAAFVGLREIATPAEFESLVLLFRKEEDIDALRSLSMALAGVMLRYPEAAFEITTLHPKIVFLMNAANPIAREIGARLAGFSRGGITVTQLLPMVNDGIPRVREEVLRALGRMDDQKAGKILFEGLLDGDQAIRECAAWALLELGGTHSHEYLLLFVAGEGSDLTRREIAIRLQLPAMEGTHFLPLIDAALEKLHSADPAYEPLLQQKISLLEANRRTAKGDDTIDRCIIDAFPACRILLEREDTARFMNILRTAEVLYQSSIDLSDADLSSPVVLWVKCMENFLHATLASRLKKMQQQDPIGLFEHVDFMMDFAWPSYRTFLLTHWDNSVCIGETTVEVPLRAVPNVLVDFHERRRKRLDQPLSVSEWARLLLFFGVDHPSGIRNLFKIPSRNIGHVIRLAHRLQSLAALRNIVAHRAAIGPSTLEAFRSLYYSSFESLVKLAEALNCSRIGL